MNYTHTKQLSLTSVLTFSIFLLSCLPAVADGDHLFRVMEAPFLHYHGSNLVSCVLHTNAGESDPNQALFTYDYFGSSPSGAIAFCTSVTSGQCVLVRGFKIVYAQIDEDTASPALKVAEWELRPIDDLGCPGCYDPETGEFVLCSHPPQE